jgi:hypothetical protein
LLLLDEQIEVGLRQLRVLERLVVAIVAAKNDDVVMGARIAFSPTQEPTLSGRPRLWSSRLLFKMMAR